MEGCLSRGKYVLLGPGQAALADLEGREPLQSSSMNLMIGLRITVTDPAVTKAVLAQLRIFPLLFGQASWLGQPNSAGDGVSVRASSATEQPHARAASNQARLAPISSR